MWSKHFILVPAIALLVFLGIYSWNQKTGILDQLAENSGLEATGVVLRSTDTLRSFFKDNWYRYIDLVNVREENAKLREQLIGIQNRLILAAEERAELKRLRDLLNFNSPEQWRPMATRVIGGRIGTNALLETITIGRGYLMGATPGTPVVTEGGLVGRVLRSGPATSTVLLISDPSSRVAVLGQETRNQGVLAGSGINQTLELRFVSSAQTVKVGEILITSGLDDIFPKGIPVAVVISVNKPDVSSFSIVRAKSLVNISRLEEVLLLERPLHDLPISSQ